MKKNIQIKTFVVAIGLLFLLPMTASAATVYSNSSTGNDTTGDGTSGTPYKTFHKAYTEASADDTINLTGTFDWTDADETGDIAPDGYVLSKSLTITSENAGTAIIQASSTAYTADRAVFTVSGVGVDVTLDNLTIRYGYHTTNSQGGGITFENSANLTILNSILTKNASGHATSGYGTLYGSSGHLIVRNSTIHGNNGYDAQAVAGDGVSSVAGFLLTGTVTAEITNSTFYNNSSRITGAISWYSSSGDLTITNSTFLNNAAVTSDLYTGSTQAYLKNNIFANSASSTPYNIRLVGGFVDGGNNIVETQSSTYFTNGVNGNLVGEQASLNVDSALAVNDAVSTVPTIALLTGSVAVNAATSTSHNGISVPALDQRAFARSGVTDIGAYEYGGVLDTTDPTVSSYFPADGATAATTTVNLILTFDGAVDAESGNITLYDSDDTVIEVFDVISDITGSGTTGITINPSSDLTEQTLYYVKIDATAFDDASGNSYAGISDSTTWNFTVGDFTDPTVTLSPLDNATAVALDANLVMTFTEAVDAESGNVTLYDSDDTQIEQFDVTLDISGSGTTEITINPTSDLSYETSYYVQVDATAFDDASSNSYAGITDTTTWSFTSADTPICTTIDNAATYNSYPACGVATCNEGYTLSDGVCNASGGGGNTPPPAIGTGTVDATIGMYKIKDIGYVDSDGKNVLWYISSQANFTTMVSETMSIEKHNIRIDNLDLINEKVTVTVQSDPITIDLSLEESKQLDLDSDGINDIEVRFADLIVNRIEITITNLISFDTIKDHLIKIANDPSVYYVDSNVRRHLFVNEVTYWTWYSGDWNDQDIMTISQKKFDAIENGINVTAKPASKLVRIGNNSNIYIVAIKSALRKITDYMAEIIYGDNYQDLIITIQNGFEIDYTKGEDIIETNKIEDTIELRGLF